MDSSQNIVTFANYQKEMLMSPIDYTHILTKAVDELSDSQSYRGLFHQHREGEPLPSGKSLERIVELSRAILFPGYFGNSTINSQTINYHIGVNIEELFSLLIEQIQAGLCFGMENSGQCDCQSPCRATATQLAAEFISRLPEIRRILATDVEAHTMVTRLPPALVKSSAVTPSSVQ